MKIEELKMRLGTKVKFKNEKVSPNEFDYILTAGIIRRNTNKFYYQAELQDAKAPHSVIICGLEEIT